MHFARGPAAAKGLWQAVAQASRSAHAPNGSGQRLFTGLSTPSTPAGPVVHHALHAKNSDNDLDLAAHRARLAPRLAAAASAAANRATRPTALATWPGAQPPAATTAPAPTATLWTAPKPATATSATSADAAATSSADDALLALLDREYLALTTSVADAAADSATAMARRHVAHVIATLRDLVALNAHLDAHAKHAMILHALKSAAADAMRLPLPAACAAARPLLHVLAQRLLARAGDLAGLREWKRFVAESHAIASGQRLLEGATTPAVPQQQQLLQEHVPLQGLAPAVETTVLAHAPHAELHAFHAPLQTAAAPLALHEYPHTDLTAQRSLATPSPAPPSPYVAPLHYPTPSVAHAADPSTPALYPVHLPTPPLHPHDASAAAAAAALAAAHRKPYLEYKSSELLALSRARQVGPAMAVFSALTAKSLTPLGDATHAYLELLAGASRMAAADAAFASLDAIEAASTAPPAKLARHRYFLYNSYLSACCSAADVARALALYHAMKARLAQLPDLRTVTRLFSLLAKADPAAPVSLGGESAVTTAAPQAAVHWVLPHPPMVPLDHMAAILDDLQAHGIQPYPLLFNLALSQAVAQSTAGLTDDHHADGTTTTAVAMPPLSAAQRMARLELAQALFERMKRGDLAHGLVTRAEQRFAEMLAHPHAQPPAGPNSAHNDARRGGPKQNGGPRRHRGTPSESSSTGAPRGVQAQFMNSIGPFNSMIQHYVHVAHDAARADHVFEIYAARFAHLVPPTGFTFHLLVSGAMLPPLAVAQAVDRALAWIRRMKSQFALRPNASHFLPVLDRLVKEEQWELARHVVDRVMRVEYRVDVRGDAIEALVATVYAQSAAAIANAVKVPLHVPAVPTTTARS
ncbi:pentatricopeptide repeat domain-containing protein [Allomyces macrogynus ATCC 38327]|uniref:Pentatricopeptide repeat domain-containing protein n=1 Tax=Allomyces macrogynus (strain ATCC 38327) TaxID=578462 RepID=A0A0L0SFC1_ALLM3|nr:pentatricopeptide repeat domain-containing protein [Allomyces macrogynus ATCC 38327]|eukprot:KNE61228.1 pentatricopeptide repeat domain-containing protein [Allomyces macrogynus ATCC 38327]